jgi:hypothetical protein
MDLEKRLERVEADLESRREMERFERDREMCDAAYRSGREDGRRSDAAYRSGREDGRRAAGRSLLGLLLVLAALVITLRSRGGASE